MAQPSKAENFFQDQSTARVGEAVVVRGRTEEHHRAQVYAKNLRERLAKSGARATEEMMAQGPRGATTAEINRLRLQINDPTRRADFEAVIADANQYLTQGYDSFPRNAKNALVHGIHGVPGMADQNGMRDFVANSSMGSAFRRLPGGEQNNIAVDLLRNDEYIAIYDQELKRLAREGNVNPNDQDIDLQAAALLATIDTLTPELKRRIAIEDLQRKGQIPPSDADIAARADDLRWATATIDEDEAITRTGREFYNSNTPASGHDLAHYITAARGALPHGSDETQVVTEAMFRIANETISDRSTVLRGAPENLTADAANVRARNEFLTNNRLTITDADVTTRRDTIQRNNLGMTSANAEQRAREELLREAVGNAASDRAVSLQIASSPQSEDDAKAQGRQELMDERIVDREGLIRSNDPTIDRDAMREIARQELVTQNQSALIDDIQNLHGRAVNILQQRYLQNARETSTDDEQINNAVVEKKLDALTRRLRSYSPEAYNENVIPLFESFVRNPDRLWDDDAEMRDILDKNPELKQKFQTEAAKEIISARMSARPPMSDNDFNKLASSRAIHPDRFERVGVIADMLAHHQIFRDVKGAAEKGGYINRSDWDKAFTQIKKNGASAGTIAALLALIFGTLTIPAGIGVPILASGILSIAGIGVKAWRGFENDDKGKTYGYEPN